MALLHMTGQPQLQGILDGQTCMAQDDPGHANHLINEKQV